MLQIIVHFMGPAIVFPAVGFKCRFWSFQRQTYLRSEEIRVYVNGKCPVEGIRKASGYGAP